MTRDLKRPTGSNISSKSPYYDRLFDRPGWGLVWMGVADTVAQRSLCDRARVGAVIVDEDQNVLAAAYNGPPPGWNRPVNVNSCTPSDFRCTSWCTRASGGVIGSDYSNCPSNHAEMNALARMTPTTKRTTAYINRLCCFTCAKALASAKVSMVVCKKTDIDDHIDDTAVREYLKNCGIDFFLMET